MASNIADLFEHAVDAFPERLAVACGDREVTFAELEEHANRLAHYLSGHGVAAGQHVGVYARNSIEAVTALLAVYKLRAVAINVNYRYVENELRYLFTDADLVALVHDRRYADLASQPWKRRVKYFLGERPVVLSRRRDHRACDAVHLAEGTQSVRRLGLTAWVVA